jgi:hypothetical protein
VQACEPRPARELAELAAGNLRALAHAEAAGPQAQEGLAGLADQLQGGGVLGEDGRPLRCSMM